MSLSQFLAILVARRWMIVAAIVASLAGAAVVLMVVPPRYTANTRLLLNFIKPALKDGALAIDWNDEVFASSCVTHNGVIRHEPTRKTVEAA